MPGGLASDSFATDGLATDSPCDWAGYADRAGYAGWAGFADHAGSDKQATRRKRAGRSKEGVQRGKRKAMVKTPGKAT